MMRRLSKPRKRLIACSIVLGGALLIWWTAWHVVWTSPEILGIVVLGHDRQMPASGVTLVMLNDRGDEHRAVTDEHGLFRFAPTKGRSWSFPGDTCFGSTLRVEHARYKGIQCRLFVCGGELVESNPATIVFVRVVLASDESALDQKIDQFAATWQYRKAHAGRAGGNDLPQWVAELDGAREADSSPP